MSKRAVLYARVSGDDRHNEGRNLAGQLDMARRYCAEQGYQVVGELAEDDRGASGAAFELPQLNQARAWAADGLYDVLIARELDRLSRNLVKQLLVEAALRQAGVTIEYVLGEYPDTPEGRLHKHIRATIAEYERELIALRTTRARLIKVRAGHVIAHGHPPFGYRVVEQDGRRQFAIVEDEAATVRRIYDLYLSGLSIRALQLQLSAEGVPTPADVRGRIAKKRAVGQWCYNTIHGILRSETYCGRWHYGKQHSNQAGGQRNARAAWIAVAVPPIVSDAVWEAVQERLAANQRLAPRNVQLEYLLRGRLTCAACGVRLGCSHDRRGYQYYRCPAATSSRTNYAHTCTMPAWSAGLVDAAVWAWLRQLLLDPQALQVGLTAAQAQAEGPLRAELREVEAHLADAQAQLGRLVDLYIAGGLARALLDERRARIEQKVQAHAQRRSELQAELTALAAPLEAAASFAPIAARIREQWPAAETDHSFRAWVVDQLDVTGRFAIEDGVKVLYARCVLSGSAAARLTTEQAQPRESRAFASPNCCISNLKPALTARLQPDDAVVS